MSTIDGEAGKALHLRLQDGKREELIDETLLTRSGRSARTLLKEGPLRVALVALAPGGVLAEHQAEGPITVHVLSGAIHFRAGDDDWDLEPGDLLSLPAGVRHSVESVAGGEFLLTVARLQAP